MLSCCHHQAIQICTRGCARGRVVRAMANGRTAFSATWLLIGFDADIRGTSGVRDLIDREIASCRIEGN
jgi:hypothetical protein